MLRKLLLVEDDITLSNDIKKHLRYQGYGIDTAHDGLLGERLILRNKYDCILLDVNMPGKNGYDVASAVRKKGNCSPIILLTGFGDINDKMHGFDCGADDYLVKPFFFQELLARIKVAIKRADHYEPDEPTAITIADLVIDTVKRQAFRGSINLRLTTREFTLLRLMADAQGMPLTKEALLKHVWDTSSMVHTNTIEVSIYHLRNKVDKDFEPKLIRTRAGFGYYLGTA